MKKLILLFVMLVFSVSCAKTMIHKDIFDPQTGKVVASFDAQMSRPIFAAMNANGAGDSWGMSSSTSFNAEQFMNTMMSAYMKYMSGGLAPTPSLPQTPAPTVGPTVQSTPLTSTTTTTTTEVPK